MIGILFDLEGTLVETKYQKKPKLVDELHQETKKYLFDQCIPCNVLNKSNKSIILRNLAYNWAYDNFNVKDFKKLRNNIENFMLTYDMASISSTTLYPDTIPTLTMLLDRNCQMGLVTNTSKKATYFMLNKYKLQKYFKIVITRNDIIMGKPEPEMILLAIKKLNNNAEYLVGDSIVDVEVAKKTSLISILIKRGYEKPKYDYDYCISSLYEIIQIISRIDR